MISKTGLDANAGVCSICIALCARNLSHLKLVASSTTDISSSTFQEELSPAELVMVQLARLVVGRSASGEGHDTLDFVFSSSTFSADVRLAHETLSSEDSVAIARALYLFCK